MIVYGQYESKNYPLKKFFVERIPNNLLFCIKKLLLEENVLLRGGLAYVFIFQNSNYVLKDIDLISVKKNKNAILQILDETSKEIYVNKNSHNQDVITAFFPAFEEFYKIDVLLENELPPSVETIFQNVLYNSVCPQYLWFNRICKIAEKKLRKHNDEKTLNHGNVVLDIARIILSKNLIFNLNVQPSEVLSKVNGAMQVLNQMESCDFVEDFFAMQNEILLRWKFI